MSKSKSLLEQAIADANDLKALALENAKRTISESVDSNLKSMIDLKLQEMEDEDASYEDDEDVNVDEILKELEDEEGAESPDEEMDIDVDAESGDVDLEKEVGSMTAEDLKALIADVISELIPTGEPVGVEDSVDLDTPSEDEMGITTGDGSEEDEEEMDLDELLAELDGEDERNYSNLRSELNEAKKAVSKYQEVIKEVKLFNAKLLYLNKILSEYTLPSNVKMKLAEKLDGVTSRESAKMIYESFKISMGTKKPSLTKKPINESLKKSIASNVKPNLLHENGVKSNKQLIDSKTISRMQMLAGIKKPN